MLYNLEDEFTKYSKYHSITDIQGYYFHPFFVDSFNKYLKYISEKKRSINYQNS